MTTRILAGGFRPEHAGISRAQLGIDRVEGCDAAFALEDYRMRKRPPQRTEQPQSVASSAPAGRPEFRLTGPGLGIAAVLGLYFLIVPTLLGNLRHDRDQAKLTAEFRTELANTIAPVGALDDAHKVLAVGIPVTLLEIPWLSYGRSSWRAHRRAPSCRRDTHGIPTSGSGRHRRDYRSGATCGRPLIKATTGQAKHSFSSAIAALHRFGAGIWPHFEGLTVLRHTRQFSRSDAPALQTPAPHISASIRSHRRSLERTHGSACISRRSGHPVSCRSPRAARPSSRRRDSERVTLKHESELNREFR
jgi:hypothetical protein